MCGILKRVSVVAAFYLQLVNTPKGKTPSLPLIKQTSNPETYLEDSLLLTARPPSILLTVQIACVQDCACQLGSCVQVDGQCEWTKFCASSEALNEEVTIDSVRNSLNKAGLCKRQFINTYERGLSMTVCPCSC